MPLQIERVGMDAKPQLNLLVYGMPGVGKTTFAAQAQSHPDLAPVLVADLEGGLLSVSARQDIDAVRVRSTQEMDELFWNLRNKTGDFGKYRTVVIDSGTNLANRALEEWSALNKDRAERKGKGSEWTVDDLQLEDYGKTLAQMRRLMTWYRDLPVNIIITALARFEFPQGADERSASPVSVGPDFTGSIANVMTGLVDHVWYMYVDENGTRHMLTQERGVYRAKTRGQVFNPTLGYHVENPSLPDLYTLMVQCETGGATPEPEPEPEPAPYIAVDADPNQSPQAVLQQVTSESFRQSRQRQKQEQEQEDDATEFALRAAEESARIAFEPQGT